MRRQYWFVKAVMATSWTKPKKWIQIFGEVCHLACPVRRQYWFVKAVMATSWTKPKKSIQIFGEVCHLACPVRRQYWFVKAVMATSWTKPKKWIQTFEVVWHSKKKSHGLWPFPWKWPVRQNIKLRRRRKIAKKDIWWCGQTICLLASLWLGNTLRVLVKSCQLPWQCARSTESSSKLQFL